MSKTTHSYLSPVTLVLIAVISAFCILSLPWKGKISSDGRGYYAYLPSLFFDHDLSFHSAIEAEKIIYPAQGYAGNYINVTDGRKVNKYFIGEAVLLAPFFLLACLVSLMTGNPVDGYSFWFQYAVSMAAFCYLLLGLNFIRKWLKLEAIPDKVIAFSLLLIFFATNLFEYSITYPSMSHVYSFFAIAWLIYSVKKYFVFQRRITLISTFIAFAFIVLIRPANSLILLLIPFLAEDKSTLVSIPRKLTADSKILFYCMLIFFTLIFIQLLAWHLETGHFITWSYTGERFNFTKPELFNFLFSYRKGFFVYTPVMFIACFGIISVYAENKYRGYSLLFFLLVTIYVLSSWWNWYYGDSFGMRSMIDFYPVFAFLLAKLFLSLHSSIAKIVLISLSFFTIYINQVQAYQYDHLILHHDEMTKAKYWGVFLKTGNEYDNIFYHTGSEVPANKIKGQIILNSKNDFESLQNDWTNERRKEVENAPSPKTISMLDSNTVYGPTFQPKDIKVLMDKVPLILIGTFNIYSFDMDSASNVQMVVSIDSANGTNYFYSSINISKSISANKTWQKITKAVYLPEIKNERDVLKFYLWNPKRKNLWLDNFDVIIALQ